MSELNIIEWLDKNKIDYELSKNKRLISEPDPNRPGWTKTSILHPDDPRFLEGYVPPFVQNYSKCLDLLEECRQLIKAVSPEYGFDPHGNYVEAKLSLLED